MSDANPTIALNAPVPSESGPPPTPPKTSLSMSEAATMAGWIKADVASGKMTPEQAQKAFDQLNVSPEQRAPDARTDEQKTFDKQFPVAKPEDFVIRWNAPGDNSPRSQEIQVIDTDLRAGLSAVGFSREVGNTLISIGSKVGEHTERMTEEQRIAWGEAEYSKLERVYGPDLPDLLRAAGRMVKAHDPTGTLTRLVQRVGNSAMVAKLLIDRAQIYDARQKG